MPKTYPAPVEALTPALRAVARLEGVQTGQNDEPLFELWTLTADLSPVLKTNFTVARFTLEAFFTGSIAA